MKKLLIGLVANLYFAFSSILFTNNQEADSVVYRKNSVVVRYGYDQDSALGKRHIVGKNLCQLRNSAFSKYTGTKLGYCLKLWAPGITTALEEKLYAGPVYQAV